VIYPANLFFYKKHKLLSFIISFIINEIARDSRFNPLKPRIIYWLVLKYYALNLSLIFTIILFFAKLCNYCLLIFQYEKNIYLTACSKLEVKWRKDKLITKFNGERQIRHINIESIYLILFQIDVIL